MASDIEAALRLAADYNVRIMIGGGAEAWKVADKLGAARVPVLTGAMNNIPATFSSLGAPGAGPEATSPQAIIRNYAPAITATGSGLFMALMNILPTWVVLIGRDLIRSMAGGPVPRGGAA